MPVRLALTDSCREKKRKGATRQKTPVAPFYKYVFTRIALTAFVPVFVPRFLYQEVLVRDC